MFFFFLFQFSLLDLACVDQRFDLHRNGNNTNVVGLGFVDNFVEHIYLMIILGVVCCLMIISLIRITRWCVQLSPSFRHPLDPSVYAIVRSDVSVRPTYRTNGGAQCPGPGIPIQLFQSVQMYRCDRSRPQ